MYRSWISVLAFSGLLSSTLPASAAPSLEGRRMADRLLSASDADRSKVDPRATAMAIRRHGLNRAALRSDFVLGHSARYTKELPATQIRDQKGSGRCWIFTALNVLERDAQVTGKPTQRLSRAYFNARNLQARAYELIKGAAEGREIVGLGTLSIGEGGTFSYALNILDKYGAVPERVLRDFQDSKASATALKLLERLVYDAQQKLRVTAKHGANAMVIVKQAHADIDRVVARAFTGRDKLPERFMVDGKEYTPKTYAAEFVGVKKDDYVSIEATMASRPGWTRVGKGVHAASSYNTRDIEGMKALVKTSIDQGKKVYVAAPVGAAGAPYMTARPSRAGATHAAPGVMSIAAFDYASLGVPQEKLDRAALQRAGLNGANHAMTITGYDLGPDGKVVKWKVENSYGTSAADRGVQHMYDDFFTHLVATVTVPRTALPEALALRMRNEKARHAILDWEPK